MSREDSSQHRRSAAKTRSPSDCLYTSAQRCRPAARNSGRPRRAEGRDHPGSRGDRNARTDPEAPARESGGALRLVSTACDPRGGRCRRTGSGTEAVRGTSKPTSRSPTRWPTTTCTCTRRPRLRTKGTVWGTARATPTGATTSPQWRHGRMNGTQFTVAQRRILEMFITQAWVRRNGTWKLASFQATTKVKPKA